MGARHVALVWVAVLDGRPGAVRATYSSLIERISLARAAQSSTGASRSQPLFHRIAGRNTAPAASSSIAPCIWLDRPIPSTVDKAAAWSRASASTTSSMACHQASGSCSLCPDDGRCTDSETVALPTTCCPPSTSNALTAEVPKSSPRYTGQAASGWRSRWAKARPVWSKR